MKDLIGIGIVLVSILGLGQVSEAATMQHLTFYGTDSMGLAIVSYEGQTYHMTEGDSLGGETYVANEVNQIIVKVKEGDNSVLVTIPLSM